MDIVLTLLKHLRSWTNFTVVLINEEVYELFQLWITHLVQKLKFIKIPVCILQLNKITLY